MHDATHVRLVAGKSYNDPVANWFCAFPAGLVTSLYRRGHLVHHSFANTTLDPYFTQMQAREHFKAPMPRRRFRSLPPGDAFGLHLKEWGDFVRPWRGWSFLFARQDGNWLSRNERIAFGLFWLAVLASVAAAGQMLYFIAIWIVPSLTFLLLFARVRIVAEHRSGHSRDELQRTRHVDAFFRERFLIAPMNINDHIAHHMFPSVPFHHVPRLHAALMDNGQFRDHALIHRSHFGSDTSVASAILVDQPV